MKLDPKALNNIDELIETLKDAPEGSEELDLAVGRVIWQGLIADNKRLASTLPRFTTSCDAAITLIEVEEGCSVAQVIHTALHQSCIGDIPEERIALVLCIAALRRMGS